jgi:glycosyltransferase involved in cell wall biosynthesis
MQRIHFISKNSFKRNTYQILIMKLSCIVPTLNEEVNVRKFLDRYIIQTQKFHELIFVDGNSKDKTREIIKEYMKNNPEIKLIICEKKGLPAARNCGLDNATGDFITTMDADSAFLDKKVVENIHLYSKGESAYLIVIYDNENIKQTGWDKYIYLLNIGRTILIIKKSICPKWDEYLGIGEDLIFYKKIKNKKITPYYFYNNEINFSSRDTKMTVSDIIKRHKWYGRTYSKYFMKTKDIIRTIKYISYIPSIIPIFWIIPFFKGFLMGLKYLKHGIDVPFGMGVVEIVAAIGTSLGFIEWLIGKRHIGRDVQ